MIEAYQQKAVTYFSHIRHDIISLIPNNPDQKILEIGAGSGSTILFLKQNGLAKEVMGVELVDMAGSSQHHELIDRFQIADIRFDNIQAQPNYFDVIICADVLEHLEDPWKALRLIAKFLKQDGLMILSVPNIREWRTLSCIVFKGDFKYEEEGILDKTHLRFFCKKNIFQLVQSSGLKVETISPNFLLTVVKEGRKRRWLNRLTFGLFQDFLTVQYLVTAKKNSS